MNEDIDGVMLYNWIDKQGQSAISCGNFYSLYRLWCIENGEKPWSNKAVGVELKNRQ